MRPASGSARAAALTQNPLMKAKGKPALPISLAEMASCAHGPWRGRRHTEEGLIGDNNEGEEGRRSAGDPWKPFETRVAHKSQEEHDKARDSSVYCSSHKSSSGGKEQLEITAGLVFLLVVTVLGIDAVGCKSVQAPTTVCGRSPCMCVNWHITGLGLFAPG